MTTEQRTYCHPCRACGRRMDVTRPEGSTCQACALRYMAGLPPLPRVVSP